MRGRVLAEVPFHLTGLLTTEPIVLLPHALWDHKLLTSSIVSHLLHLSYIQRIQLHYMHRLRQPRTISYLLPSNFTLYTMAPIRPHWLPVAACCHAASLCLGWKCEIEIV